MAFIQRRCCNDFQLTCGPPMRGLCQVLRVNCKQQGLYTRVSVSFENPMPSTVVFNIRFLLLLCMLSSNVAFLLLLIHQIVLIQRRYRKMYQLTCGPQALLSTRGLRQVLRINCQSTRTKYKIRFLAYSILSIPSLIRVLRIITVA